MQRVTSLLTATAVIMTGATLGTDAQTRRDRFRMHGETDTEQTPSVDARGVQLPAPRTTEAPTGFDNRTNGFRRRDRLSIRSMRTMSFRCVRSTTTASSSRKSRPWWMASANLQRPELPRMPPERGNRRRQPDRRTSHGPHGPHFFESLGGSLIQSRATHPGHRRARQLRGQRQHVPDLHEHARRGLRGGDREQHAACKSGTVQPAALRGNEHSRCPSSRPRAASDALGVSAGKPSTRASSSFAADAYLNEMGITTPSVSRGKTLRAGIGQGTELMTKVHHPEDDGIHVVAFADFMRATKAPARGRINGKRPCGRAGSSPKVGCAVLPRAIDHDRAARHRTETPNSGSRRRSATR